MKRTLPLFHVWMVSMLLVGGVSCNKPEANDDDSSADAKTAAGTPDANNDSQSGQEPSGKTDSKKKVCDIITFADLKGITGAVYTSTESQADFSNIKHCGYFSADVKHSISLTVAFGTTAQERMDQSRVFPSAVPVADFGDEAVWLPATGTLTAKFSERCVEVRISKAHGDDATRIDFAKRIINLALERF